MPRHRSVILVGLAVAAYSPPARAWLFHEHTAIGRTAVQSLPESDARVLREAWSDLRADTARLCPSLARPDTDHVLGPRPHPPDGEVCFDLPMLAAAAADFSCSPEELWENVRASDWLPKIAISGHETGVSITELQGPPGAQPDIPAIRDAWHRNHLDNFELDPAYLDRARGNLAHFTWPRKTDDLDAYLLDALAPGRAPNAMAFYVVHHVAAVRFASRAASMRHGPSRAEQLRWMFLSEATALHYLEDAFSAGHGVGRAGDSRDRAGTHDFYCENGVEGRLWPAGCDLSNVSNTYLAHGDAFMTREDQRHAAASVRMSLRDLAHVLTGEPCHRAVVTSPTFAPAELVGDDSMDACVASSGARRGLDSVPPWARAAASDPWISAVLSRTILPALSADSSEGPLHPASIGLVEPRTALPVFSAQLGIFVGAFAAGRVTGAPGFGSYGDELRFGASGDAGVVVGFGAGGIATARSDAQIVLSLGGVLQSVEVDKPFVSRPIVPARMGFSVRLRMPFRVLPGVELFYVVPGLLAGSSSARRWLIEAAETGFLGLQRSWHFAGGAFQIVLLREVGLRYLVTSEGRDASIGLEMPLFEWRPQPWYSGSFGSSFSTQLGFSLDTGRSTASAGLFLRVGFDAKRYVASPL